MCIFFPLTLIFCRLFLTGIWNLGLNTDPISHPLRFFSPLLGDIISWGFQLHLVCKESLELSSCCGLLAKFFINGAALCCFSEYVTSLALVAEVSLMSEFFWWSTQSLWFSSQSSVIMGNIAVGLGLTSQVINISSGHYHVIMLLQRYSF